MRAAVLRVVAAWMSQLLVAESGVDQLLAARERSSFVAKACGVHAAVAATLVCGAGVMKLLCVVARCVPSLAEERRAMLAASAAMCVTCAVEAAVAVASGDVASALATAVLGLVYVQQLLVYSSSRHLRTYTGIVDTRSSIADGATSALRSYAMRYKLRAQATWAIAALLAYAAAYNTSLRASTPLARALAWQEARCTAAGVALAASVGAADERAADGGWGRKKAL